MGVIGPSQGETATFLRDLSRKQTNALCGVLGVARAKTVEATAAAVEEACARPATLDALLASLPEDETRDFLLTCALLALDGRVSLYDEAFGSATDAFGDPEAAYLADELEDRGLVWLRGDGEVVLLPCLARALQRREMEARTAPIPCEAGDAPPYAFFLAVLACVYGEERPSLTRSGLVNANSVKRIEKRLGGPRLFGYVLNYGADCLHAFGVLRPEGDWAHRTLVLDAAAGAAALAADPGDLSLACLAHQAGSTKLRTLAQLRAAVAKGSGEPVTLEEIQSCPRRAARGDIGGGLPDSPLDTRSIAEDLRSIRGLGLARRVAEGPSARFLSSTPASPGSGRWVVQPSFEVLVPWDAPPSQVVGLSLVADLESADRVCRFRVTKAAVQRGLATAGPRPEERTRILEALALGASGPLPQNVRATVEGWLRSPGPLRAVRGDVLIASDDDQRGFVRRAVPGVEEVAPGVFLLPDDFLEEVRRCARKAGVPLAEHRWGSQRRRTEPVHCLDLEATAKRARSTLDGMREPPKPKPRPRGMRDAWNDRVRGEPDEGMREVVERIHLLPVDEGPPMLGDAWQTLLPGALREVLRDAIASHSPVRLLRTDGKGGTSEAVVVPRSLRGGDDEDALRATDEGSGLDVTIPLDSITAVREAGP